MTVASPWQWFCSTRTFSNSLETTLTVVALYFWPWKLSSDTVLGSGSDASQIVDEDKPVPKADTGVFGTARAVKQ